MNPNSKLKTGLYTGFFLTLTKMSTFLIVWAMISTIIFLKIPSAFTKIYAEDGAVALQSALDKSFPSDLFTPVAGYSDIILRVAGRIATFFPLSTASNFFFFFNTLLLSFIFIVVYQVSESFLNTKISRAILATSLILIPIGSFESIGNVANLHFYFMSACLPIFISRNKTLRNSWGLCILVFVATASLPLMFFYIPLILFTYLQSDVRGKQIRIDRVELSYLLGLIYQFIFIITQAFGERSTGGTGSIGKVIYLYLDRVVGSAFIPWWGHISSDSTRITPNFLSTQMFLALRALTALAVLILVVVLTLKANTKIRKLSAVIIFSGLLYWLTVGLIFSPEPRYAIFPSFSLILVVLMSLSSTTIEKRESKIRLSIFFLCLTTWATSWNPSPLRVTGPTWTSQLHLAEKACSEKGPDEIAIRIIPMNKYWSVTIDCNMLSHPTKG